MPDPLLILESAAVAATLAALGFLAARPWRHPAGGWPVVGAAFGAGVGFFAGACVLGYAPHLPPQEDQDRFLLIVLPAAVAVEVGCAFLGRTPWLLRSAVALAVAPVLLYGSVYVSDAAGPDGREWAGYQLWLILGALGLALMASWALLARLANREAGSGALPALALACGGAGLVVMLSGYASGGQLRLMLAAALIPAAVAAFCLGRSSAMLRGALGVGVVGLFALLIVGRFFAGLTTTNAALLFFAPLLGWLPELPLIRRLGARWRRPVGAAVAAVAVAVALTLAVQKFNADSRAPSEVPGAIEPTVDDYLNFGK